MLGNLIQLTNLVINKGVPLSTVGRVFALSIPLLIGYTLPIACLISVIITFSRFSADNEILALRASGVHLGRLLQPLVFLGIILTLFSLILNDRIIPYAHYEQHKALKTLGSSNPTALLEPGMFITAFEKQILFIHKIEGNKMSNITIYQPQEDAPTRTIIAKYGEFTPVPGGDRIKLKLINGTSDEPNLEDPENFYKLNFKTYFMTLDLSKDAQEIQKKPKGMTLKELKSQTEHYSKIFIDPSRYQVEYHRKITWSFAAFIFILLGFPIAVITHKREKSANIVLAMICGAFYYLLTMGCEAIGLKTAAPPAVVMWIPNIITFIAASVLIKKCVS